MIRLNLKEIFKSRKKFSQKYKLQPEELKLPPDLGELSSPVELYVEITREKGGYRVFLKLEGQVKLQCSRCLTHYDKDIGREEVVRIEPYPTRDKPYLKPSELEVSFFEDEESFDLLDLLREQIILSIPTKPLCSPDCQLSTDPDVASGNTTLGDLFRKASML